MDEAERIEPMGRAEERRARQRGGRRAAPKRRRSSGAGGKSGIRRLFTWKKILGTFFGLCLLGMGSFIVLYLVIDIPEGNPEAELQSNVYKYSDGSIMTRTGDRNREIVDLAKVPKEVQRTFVAAENKTFYKDSGVDLKGTARGVLNTLSGKGAQGGSTITQQYVKNYYLSQEQTVTRKLKELVISLKLDREKSKDYILAGYINTSYYGRGAYGIQAAAQAYYRVDAEDLTVEQGAYLAALLQAPNQYDWAIASETGKKLVQERWNYVLDNMVEEDWLSRADRQGMEFPVPEEPKTSAGMGARTAIWSTRPTTRSGSSWSRRAPRRTWSRPRRSWTSADTPSPSTSTGRSRRSWRRPSRPSSPASSTPTSARSTPTSRPAPSPSTRRRAASWRCTAAWTT